MCQKNGRKRPKSGIKNLRDQSGLQKEGQIYHPSLLVFFMIVGMHVRILASRNRKPDKLQGAFCFRLGHVIRLTRSSSRSVILIG